MRRAEASDHYAPTRRGGHALRIARAAVVARDGARCRRCGEGIDLALPGTSPYGLTLGHILPIARGGTDAFANLAPEHRRCNLGAGADLAPTARIARPFG